MRRLVQAAAALMLVAATTVTTAGPALAANQCAKAPTSIAPWQAAGTAFDPYSAVSPSEVDTVRPAPSRPGGDPTYYQYGWSGLSFHSYEDGIDLKVTCVPNGIELGNTLAGIGAGMLTITVAFTSLLSRVVHDPTTYDFLDVIGVPLAAVAGASFSKLLFTMAAVCIAVWMVWFAERRSPRENARTTSRLLILATLAAVTWLWSGGIAEQANRALMAGVSAVDQADPTNPSSLGESMHKTILMPMWTSGTFSRTSVAGTKYGPALFAAQAISNEEAVKVRFEPKALDELAKKDAEQYEAIAAKVEKEDPHAYEALAGRMPSARLGGVFLAWLTYLWTGPAQLLADSALIFGMVFLRIAIYLAPITLAIGLVFKKVLESKRDRIVGVCGGVVLLAAGATLCRLIGAALNSAANPAGIGLSVTLGLASVSVVWWYVMFPALRLMRGKPMFKQSKRKTRKAGKYKGFGDTDKKTGKPRILDSPTPEPYRRSSPGETTVIYPEGWDPAEGRASRRRIGALALGVGLATGAGLATVAQARKQPTAGRDPLIDVTATPAGPVPSTTLGEADTPRAVPVTVTVERHHAMPTTTTTTTTTIPSATPAALDPGHGLSTESAAAAAAATSAAAADAADVVIGVIDDDAVDLGSDLRPQPPVLRTPPAITSSVYGRTVDEEPR